MDQPGQRSADQSSLGGASISVITDVVLHLDYAPDEFRGALLELDVGALSDRGPEYLHQIDTSESGGTKVFTGEICAGAFNHLAQEELVNAILELPKREYVTATLSLISEFGIYDVVIFNGYNKGVKRLCG